MLCLQNLLLEMKSLIPKLPEGCSCQRSAVSILGQAPGAHPCSRQWGAVEGFCTKLWHLVLPATAQRFVYTILFPLLSSNPHFFLYSSIHSCVHSPFFLPSTTTHLLFIWLISCWHVFPCLFLRLWSGSLTLPPSALTCLTTAILSPRKLNSNHCWQKGSQMTVCYYSKGFCPHPTPHVYEIIGNKSETIDNR